MTQPVYIAFEGPEACGKSTQAQRLAESIGAVLTRETGGTDIGEGDRDIEAGANGVIQRHGEQHAGAFEIYNLPAG